jgi:hypothetical protein
MNAGFIGIGSMGGTLVRALATESHGDLGGTTSRLRLFNSADAEHRELRSFFTAAGLAMGREFNFPSPQSKEGNKHFILFSRFCGKLREICRRGNVTTRLCEANPWLDRTSNCRSPARPCFATVLQRFPSPWRSGDRFSWSASTSATWQIRCFLLRVMKEL